MHGAGSPWPSSGFTVDLANGRKLWIYGREPEVARAANSMTLDDVRSLAKKRGKLWRDLHPNRAGRS